MSGPLIETKGLKKYFKTPAGPLHAVDGVDLAIEAGTTLGVVGESGCGKSTLGRVILRLTDATEGQILYRGRDILTLPKNDMAAIRRELQLIFQDPFSSLNPRMTVSDIIAEPIKVCKLEPDKKAVYRRVDRLMDTVGLAQRFANAYPHELDGGRRQRIGIARALAVDPAFIVCDEPVSALDVSIQAQILNLLMDLQEELNLTYLFITHDLSVVKHISREIAVMYLGQCIERTTAQKLFEDPKHPYTRALLAAIPIPELKRGQTQSRTLKGEVPNPVNPKPGCRFAPRCDRAADRCREGDVTLKEVSPGHFAACRLYE